jgi:hypothetical protein
MVKITLFLQQYDCPFCSQKYDIEDVLANLFFFQFAVDPDGFFASDLVLGFPILIGNVAINSDSYDKPQLLFQVTSKFNAETLFGNQRKIFQFQIVIFNGEMSQRCSLLEKGCQEWRNFPIANFFPTIILLY